MLIGGTFFSFFSFNVKWKITLKIHEKWMLLCDGRKTFVPTFVRQVTDLKVKWHEKCKQGLLGNYITSRDSHSSSQTIISSSESSSFHFMYIQIHSPLKFVRNHLFGFISFDINLWMWNVDCSRWNVFFVNQKILIDWNLLLFYHSEYAC